jgi:hypothetical protein
MDVTQIGLFDKMFNKPQAAGQYMADYAPFRKLPVLAYHFLPRKSPAPKQYADPGRPEITFYYLCI